MSAKWIGCLPLLLIAACSDAEEVGNDAGTKTIEQSIAELQSTNAAVADQAYGELFAAKVAAIEPLVTLAQSAGSAEYAGGAFQNDRSSVRTIKPPLQIIALYLIEGILRNNPTPYAAPRLISVDEIDERELLPIAVQRFSNWWMENRTLPIAQLAATNPLAGDNPALFWLGPIFPLVPPPPPVMGTERPRSGTPADPDPRKDMPHPSGRTGARKVTPLGTSTITPYNCLAWALNCQRDRWLQPGAQPGGGTATVDQILMDNGYSTTSTTCGGGCPPGRGPKAKLIWDVPAGGMPNSSNWVHAMKQEADGDWTSKNGDSSLFDDIENCDAFVRRHYPPSANLTVRCYCK